MASYLIRESDSPCNIIKQNVVDGSSSTVLVYLRKIPLFTSKKHHLGFNVSLGTGMGHGFKEITTENAGNTAEKIFTSILKNITEKR